MNAGIASIYYSVFAIMFVFTHVGLYKLFEKASESGWKALIPFYNYYVCLQIIDKPKWWMMWAFLPIVNLVMPFIIFVELCKSFGKGGLGAQTMAMLFPFIYLPYMGFNNDIVYEGSSSNIYAGQPRSSWREWADAIIFALIAATFIRTFFVEAYKIPTSSMESTMMIGDHLFVSKFHFGARFPITPIAFPLAHHTMPVIKTKAYWDGISLPYFRFPGLQKVHRNDIVVFNFPEGDTVVAMQQNQSYYTLKRLGNTYRRDQLIIRPVDKEENYVKRCVAIAGDKLEVRQGILMINDEKAYKPPHMQWSYRVTVNHQLSQEFLRKWHIDESNIRMVNAPHNTNGFVYVIHMPEDIVDDIKQLNFVTGVQKIIGEKEPVYRYSILFPNKYDEYPWDLDNYGPINIPKAGETITLNPKNLYFYKRIIQVYEHNSLQIKDGKLYINGKQTTQYTFRFNYYFMMGDNRHNSQDSRFWGFVPEDHIVGKAWFVWFSWDKNAKGFFNKIRWNRFMKFVH